MALSCVVVGFDGSEPAERAYRFACRLVDPRQGRLLVVSAHLDRPEIPERDEVALRGELESAAVALVGSSGDDSPSAEVVVRDGHPQAVLADVARESDADLIVVGSRGRGGLARALFGSVSAGLTEDAPVPVAVVR